jgi:hypothetical protein
MHSANSNVTYIISLASIRARARVCARVYLDTGGDDRVCARFTLAVDFPALGGELELAIAIAAGLGDVADGDDCEFETVCLRPRLPRWFGVPVVPIVHGRSRQNA